MEWKSQRIGIGVWLWSPLLAAITVVFQAHGTAVIAAAQALEGLLEIGLRFMYYGA